MASKKGGSSKAKVALLVVVGLVIVGFVGIEAYKSYDASVSRENLENLNKSVRRDNWELKSEKHLGNYRCFKTCMGLSSRYEYSTNNSVDIGYLKNVLKEAGLEDIVVGFNDCENRTTDYEPYCSVRAKNDDIFVSLSLVQNGNSRELVLVSSYKSHFFGRYEE